MAVSHTRKWNTVWTVTSPSFRFHQQESGRQEGGFFIPVDFARIALKDMVL